MAAQGFQPNIPPPQPQGDMIQEQQKVCNTSKNLGSFNASFTTNSGTNSFSSYRSTASSIRIGNLIISNVQRAQLMG
jgi:hypothetical protein